MRCPYCFQMFDQLPCGDEGSDMTEEEMIVAGGMLRDRGIIVRKLRFSGGEPLLHPNVKRLSELAKERWRPTGWFKIFTGGIPAGMERGDLPRAGRLRWNPPKAKAVFHQPVLVSPLDVGLKMVWGVGRPCKFQAKCGAAFDAYGFSPCTRAWSLGRLFGFEVHSREPSLVGWEELCRHCLHSVSEADRLKVRRDVLAGKMEYPSRTFRWAIKRRRAKGFLPLKRFGERRL